MSVEVNGLVFLKKDQNKSDFVNKILNGINEFYMDKLKEAIKKTYPDNYHTYKIELSSLPDIERRKFSIPKIEHIFDGFFYCLFSFASEKGLSGVEMRSISFTTNLEQNDNIIYAEKIGNRNKEELSIYQIGLCISLDCGGSAEEIIRSILSHVGNEAPSYLVRCDTEDSFDETNKNVVKIGNYKTNISPVAISEIEYSIILKEELEENKTLI